MRRITGLTGPPAAAANSEAARLAAATAALSKLSGEALEKAVSELKVELDTCVVGAVKKAALKASLGEVQKVLLEAAKKAAAGNKALIVAAAKAAAEAAAAKGDKFCVVSVDMLDAAAVRDAVTQVSPCTIRTHPRTVHTHPCTVHADPCIVCPFWHFRCRRRVRWPSRCTLWTRAPAR